MSPLTLRLHDCRTFADAELTFGPGVTCLLGANGAGKSTLMDALRYALTGVVPRGANSRDHAALLNPGGHVELDVTAAGEVYRIRREWNGKKATCRFTRRDAAVPDHDPDVFEALDPADIPATLGLGERPDDLLRHTVLCGQGDLAALTEAAPAYRKELLGEALGLREYGLVAEAAKARADAAQRQAETAAAVLAQWEPVAKEREARQAALASAEDEEAVNVAEVAEWREKVTQAEQTLGAAKGAVEKWTEKQAQCGEGRQQVLSLERHRDCITEELCEVRAQLADLPKLRELAATAPTHRARLEVLNALRRAFGDAQKDLEAACKDDTRLRQLLDEAQRDSALLDEVPCSPEVHVGDGARGMAEAHRTCPLLANARERAKTVAMLTGAAHESAEVVTLAQDAEKVAFAHLKAANDTTLPESVRSSLAAAEAAEAQVRALAAAETELATLEAELRGLDERIAEHQAVRDGLAGASEKLQEAQDLAARAAQARQDVRAGADEAETLLRTAQRTTAEARAAVKASVEAQARVYAATAEIEGWSRRLTVARELQARCGRDGIPARLVEESIPDIEARANDLLELLSAGTMRLAVATTKDLANGRIVEALEFVVATGEGERPYRLLSGGERVRVDLALRVGIAQLLAHRAGVAPEFLVLDEPASGLDAQGLAALVEGLPALAALFPGGVVVVEHIEALKEAGDRTFVVVKRDGASTLEAA